MSLPDKTTILIVGAGPAGLAAALSLYQQGFRDFIIVDAIPNGRNVSRAVLIHAATLEALDTIGCGEDILSQGLRTTVFNIENRSTKLCSPHIEGLKSHTRHPYILIIPQNVTEHVLEKKLVSLGVTIHRPMKVVGLKTNTKNPNLSDVAFEDGRVITAKYVVGADGARSAVRTMAGIGFSDPTFVAGQENNNLAQMVLADVTFDNVNDDGAMSITLTPNSVFLFFPLPPSFNESVAAGGQISTSERIYRIGCGVPVSEGEIPHSASREYLQNLVDRFGPHRLSSDPSINPNSKPTCIKDVIWRSRFRNHASIADTTFTRLGSREQVGQGGVIVLIGDAAHIHSPVGGQGMNLGLRDAIFLGEALAKHNRANKTKPLAETDDSILYEFTTARHARALEVIKLTKGLLSVIGMEYRERLFWWCPIDSATIRSWALWVLGQIRLARDKMAWELSGLSRR